MAGLTWNRRNAFADGAAEDGGGLSRLGRELVDRLVSLGVILDLAHASRGAFAEILERVGGAPVLCSHGGCRGVYDTPRNLDDDQLRAIAQADGLFGLMLHPIAIGPEQRTIDGVSLDLVRDWTNVMFGLGLVVTPGVSEAVDAAIFLQELKQDDEVKDVAPAPPPPERPGWHGLAFRLTYRDEARLRLVYWRPRGADALVVRFDLPDRDRRLFQPVIDRIVGSVRSY